MKRFVGYLLLGLAAYLVFMIMLFPAATVVGLIAQRLPGLTLEEVQGSVVKGRARGVRFQELQFASLSWQWRPLALFMGRISYHMRIEEPQLTLQGSVSVGPDRQLQISDLTGGLPLSRAIYLLGRPISLPLDGRVIVELAELHLDKDGRPHTAYGTLQLVNTRTTWGGPVELGDFSAELITEEQIIRGNVNDAGGPIEASGTLTLAPDRRYRFIAQLAARDKDNRQLQQTLDYLGEPSGDGTWEVDFAGVL